MEDEAKIQAIIAANAHRHPERSTLKLIGDRGKEVELPLVLAHPSGACRVPDGKKPSPVWGVYVASLLGIAKAPDGSDQMAAADCILWPDVQTVAQWRARWPAIDGRIWRAVKVKTAADISIIDEPEFSDSMPDAVKASYDGHPQASLRRFSPTFKKKTHALLCVIDPPQAAAWTFFQEGMRKPGVDAWRLVCEMAQATCRIFYDETDGREMTIAEVQDIWPGIIILANLTVAVLAGAAAEVERGE